MMALIRPIASVAFVSVGVSLAALASWGPPAWALDDDPPIRPPGQEEAPPGDVPIAESSTEDPSANPSAPATFLCPTDEPTTVVSIVPRGCSVTAGQRICELDTTDLRDQYVNQQIAAERAKADFENARRTWEVAQAILKEYIDFIYPQEFAIVEGEIELAEAELDLARAVLDRERERGEQGEPDPIAIKRAEVDVLRTEFNLERATGSKTLLERYTYPRRLKALEGDVAVAEIEMWAKESSSHLQQQKQEQLLRQLEACRIDAPFNGVVTYPEGIEPGCEVQSGQLILTCSPLPPEAGRPGLGGLSCPDPVEEPPDEPIDPDSPMP